jgi:predicted metal-dependent phosphoesterase TrpH
MIYQEIFKTDKVWYKGHISYNLHNHTEYSDWEHSVEELINEAKSKIITHLSITDHDNILAYTTWNALDIAKEKWIFLIPWVEATVGFDKNVWKPHVLLYFREKLLENIKFLEDFDDTIWKARWKDFLQKRIDKYNNLYDLDLKISDFDQFLWKSWYNWLGSKHFREIFEKKYNYTSQQANNMTSWKDKAYIPPSTDYKIVKELKEKYDLKAVLAHPICDFHTLEQKIKIRELILELIDDKFLDWLEIYHPDVSKKDRDFLKTYNVKLHTAGSDTHYRYWRKLSLRNLYKTNIFNKK